MTLFSMFEQKLKSNERAVYYQYLYSPLMLTFDEVEQVCGFSIDHSFLNAKKEMKFKILIGGKRQ